MEISLKVLRSSAPVERLRRKVNRWQRDKRRAYYALDAKRPMLPLELMGRLLLRCPDTGHWAAIPEEILSANI